MILLLFGCILLLPVELPLSHALSLLFYNKSHANQLPLYIYIYIHTNLIMH